MYYTIIFLIVLILLYNIIIYLQKFFIMIYFLNTFRLFYMIFDRIIDSKIKKYKRQFIIDLDSDNSKNLISNNETVDYEYLEKLSKYFYKKMKKIDGITLYSSFFKNVLIFSTNNINNRFFACAFENIWNPKFNLSNIIVFKINKNHSYQDIDILVNKIKILVYKIKKLNLSNFYSNYILNKIDYLEN